MRRSPQQLCSGGGNSGRSPCHALRGVRQWLRNVEELQRALDFPWEKWMVFLHPDQRQWVERDYNGPARVSGSAGTGKTIVALHRAAHLARTNPEARILLTTFSDTLANTLRTKLKRLIGSEPRLAERIDVRARWMHSGVRLHKSHCRTGGPGRATRRCGELTQAKLSKAVGGHKFSLHFLLTEWEQVVDAWQLETWESYRDVARLGRKTRLPEAQRTVLWSIFERVRAALKQRKLTTHAGLFTSLASALSKGKHPPFDFAVVDEAQDISVAASAFLLRAGWRVGPMPFSSLAISVNGYSSSPSPGNPSAWTSAGDPTRCASTTARPTKSGCKRIDCLARKWWTWMAIARSAAIRSRSSMGRRP